MHRTIPTLLAVFGSGFALSAQAPPPPDVVDFAREIRPLLSENCFACHGPDAKQRKRGLRLDTAAGTRARLATGKAAVVPGDPDASELLHRVTTSDPERRMPPPASGKKLTAEQIAKLRLWIAGGAHWEEHWSFVAPRVPTIPKAAIPKTGIPKTGIPKPARTASAVDAFIRAKLRGVGLAPAPEARRETLIRRVTFDLTGLPPTVPEVEAFLQDDRPGAYERVVDRLLASPAYGEHMARHWLDAARYGDTHGYHLDNRREMWPYRDWVIRAFNANMPFDRFTIEQLAGDQLPEPTNDQLIATGFNRCNITTAEGGLIAEEYLAKYAMDRVETTATVFLGLTAGCATCHDHKYDPISQRDFYRLFAFFNSIDEAASDKNQPIAPPFTTAPSPAQERQRAELEAKIATLTEQMRAPLPAIDAAQADWEREQRSRLGDTWKPLRPLSAKSRGGATMRVQQDLSVLVTGTSPEHDVYEVVAQTDLERIAVVRLEALTSAEQPGKGIGRASHSNIVLSGFTVETAPAGAPDDWQPVQLTDATADYSQRDYDVHRALDGKAATGWAIDAERRDLQAVFAAAAPFGHGGGTRLRVRLHFESRHPQHTIGRFRLSVTERGEQRPAVLGTWHVVGPFRAKSFAAAFDTAFPPEKRIDLGAPAGGQRWRKRPELVDSKVHMLKGANAATYLYRRIDSPSARPMTLFLGSDDGCKLFLNGAPVLSRKVARAVKPDQDRVTIDLRKGENHLLLKVVNGGGGYGFYFRVLGEATEGVPVAVANALLAHQASAAQRNAVRDWFRRHRSPEWKGLETRRTEVRAQLADLQKRIPRTMIMRERKEPRQAHVLIRGMYDRKGEKVDPGVPAVFPKLAKSGDRATRLDLARWLVAPDHPLTARVTVNRFWQQLFGTGLVKTAEDFGAQGEWPSHPELLDWLATHFVRSGWDVKAMMRLLVTSATYRQSSRTLPEHLRVDPNNRLLARGPRFRLDAEAIRDNALALAGSLVRTIGGPSVKPYQPAGIWFAVGYTSSNTARFVQDKGDKLYRRSMYTFWKRTAAPPTMVLFDAPSREHCRVRRERTNTPLQALALMNDIQHVEAARGFAARMLRRAGDERARLTWGFRATTARAPDDVELDTLRDLLHQQLARYRSAPADAAELLGVGESKADPALDATTLAAWTTVASVLLNLDETITKG